MILVTRPGYTQGSVLNKALEELTEEEELRLLGAIVNGVDRPVVATPVAAAPVEEVAPIYQEEPVLETEEPKKEEEPVPTGVLRS
jgi:Mrp family chromosome partitioning ATPase